MDTRSFIRPLVRSLRAYAPGEQPKIPGLVKLNTNENPYPPSPRVLRAVKAAVDARLRLYPPPAADALRERIARLHGCDVENIVVGNGSDDLLALATRAFVEPCPTRRIGKSTVQWFSPSYSLYPVLARAHGATEGHAPLEKDFSFPSLKTLKATKTWRFDAALTFITTPNAPSGRGYGVGELDALCAALKGVVVLDEAYVDFGPEHAMALAFKRANTLVMRTFSKSYALCFQRVGYAVGHPDLIGALHKIRDSYNVNGLGQVAALATLDDLPYYRKNLARVVATRERLGRALAARGFDVLPSATNFLLVRPPGRPAMEWLGQLRLRKILVRWFDTPEIRDYLRITVGTDAEAGALLKAVHAILDD
ncbi:MAG TPA: histidinol-phosphate transaminase [Planctomycetota bacterium]